GTCGRGNRLRLGGFGTGRLGGQLEQVAEAVDVRRVVEHAAAGVVVAAGAHGVAPVVEDVPDHLHHEEQRAADVDGDRRVVAALRQAAAGGVERDQVE